MSVGERGRTVRASFQGVGGSRVDVCWSLIVGGWRSRGAVMRE
jgi:hypothetical protein